MASLNSCARAKAAGSQFPPELEKGRKDSSAVTCSFLHPSLCDLRLVPNSPIPTEDQTLTQGPLACLLLLGVLCYGANGGAVAARGCLPNPELCHLTHHIKLMFKITWRMQSVDVAAPQHALLRCDAISLVVLLAL